MPELVQNPSKPNSSKEVQRVSLVSLGCPKNLVDSEKMLGLMAQDGLTVVSFRGDVGQEEGAVDDADMKPVEGFGEGAFDGADAVVINTCGFLEASKDESLSIIKEAVREKHAGRLKRVVVAGCLVQRHRAKMLQWEPGIDAMIGVFDRDKIIEAVRGVTPDRATLDQASDKPSYWINANALSAAKARGMQTTGLTVNGKDGKGIGYFEDDSARLRLTPRHYAYLRISEGCNQNCAFCTIPSIRGKMRSKPIDRIQTEARELIADGTFELNLIGQDTTSYGDDIGQGAATGGGLSAMLRSVCTAFEREQAPGWVRLMYAYPSNFSDEMIDTIAELSILNTGRTHGVLPYIDIPLQHGSDQMLRAMRRNVSASHQLELMHKLRDRVPGMAIRTTFISGFPGETEEDHEQLLEFVEEVGFDAVGVFTYSHEDGTVAGTMEDDPSLRVPEDVKQQRKDEVMALQQRIAFEQAEYLAEQFDENNPADTGVRLDVLIDKPVELAGADGKRVQGYTGRTYFQAPQIDAVTYVQSKRPLAVGELVKCVVVASEGYDLIARPVEDVEKRVSLSVLGR